MFTNTVYWHHPTVGDHLRLLLRRFVMVLIGPILWRSLFWWHGAHLPPKPEKSSIEDVFLKAWANWAALKARQEGHVSVEYIEDALSQGISMLEDIEMIEFNTWLYYYGLADLMPTASRLLKAHLDELGVRVIEK